MKRLVLALLALSLLLTGGCGGRAGTTVSIVRQYGTAYAPIALMAELQLLDDLLPEGVEVDWPQLSNTTEIREAMLAGQADIACMAIPPFLIGLDGGMTWKICAAVSEMPMGLVARDPAVTGIADITPDMRIALPQPGSIQHILLAMAARQTLGRADIFDTSLVTMRHPDGMSALLAGGDVALHFTTAPYLQMELDAGMHLILTGEEAMGEPFTGIVAVSDTAFRSEHPEVYAAFLTALEAAVALLQTDPRGCAELLAPVYEMEPQALYAELTADGALYTTEVRGLEPFNRFLYETGYTDTVFDEAAMLFEEVECLS